MKDIENLLPADVATIRASLGISDTQSGATPLGSYWFVNPGAAVGVWGAGSDLNDGKSRAAPFATLAKVLAVASDYDTVRFSPGAVIKEQWGISQDGTSSPNYSTIINFEGDPTSPAIFQNFDNFTGTWTNDGTGNNTYTTTWARPFWSTTTTPNGSNLQAQSYRMLLDHLQMIEVTVTSSPFGSYQVTTEAAALALVRATPGTFYVQGYNGSCMTKGWQQLTGGNTDTIFAHAHDNAAPNANGRKVSFGARMAPGFNRGSILKNFIVMGGVGHNGVVMRDCLVENVKIMFPLHHATFCTGANMINLEIYGGNKSGGGYAFHRYDGQNNPNAITRITNCKVIDYTGNICVVLGGHGTGANTILDKATIVENLYVYNCPSLGTANMSTKGAIFIRPTLINVSDIGGGTGDVLLVEPTIANSLSSIKQSGTMAGITVPDLNSSLTIDGGTSTWGHGTFLSFNKASNGNITIKNHQALVAGDVSSKRWLTMASGSCTYTGSFTISNSIIASDWGGPVTALDVYTPAAITINATNSHFSGLKLSATNLTYNMTNCTVGGGTGMYRGSDNKLALKENNFVDLLGYKVLGATSYSVNAFGGSSSYVHILTTRNLVSYSGNGFSTGTLPAGTWNGITSVKGAGNVGIIYGANGAVAKGALSAITYALVSGTPSKNWIGHVTTTNVDTVGVTWLLADDGTIYKYDATTDQFTAATINWTGSAFKCIGGYYDGTDIIVWGGDAEGSGAGTYGGILQSTDGGTTFNQILDSASNYATNIGNYARKMKCGLKNNGVWTLFGTMGTMLIGSKGASYTASISGTTMTVTAMGSNPGVIMVGDTLSGTNVTGGTTVVSQLTGTTGGVGTYTVSTSQTTSSTTITSTNTKMAFTYRDTSTEIDFMNCVHNTHDSGQTGSYKKILLSGYASKGGSTSRGTFMVMIDSTPSATNATLWTIKQVKCPVESGVGAMALPGAWYIGSANQTKFVVVGKVLEIAHSTDGNDWMVYHPERWDATTIDYPVGRETANVTALLP